MLLLIYCCCSACGPGAYIDNGYVQDAHQVCINRSRTTKCVHVVRIQPRCLAPGGFFNAEKAQARYSWTQPKRVMSANCAWNRSIGNIISCAVGKFKCVMLQCDPCAKMTFQSQTKSLSCITCQQGKYQYNAGAVQCLDCPTQGSCCSGYEVVNGTCTACDSSHYELDGTCVTCPEHHMPMFSRLGSLTYVQQGANACLKCSPGTMLNDSICVQCPVGRYEQNNSCLPCAIGTYQPQQAQQECLQCSNGFYTTEEGQNECTPCAANTFGNASGCFACVSPLVSPIGSSTCYESCPGEWIFDGTTCAGCPLGQIGSNGTCVHCPAGKIRPNEYDNICTECPEGKITDPNQVACLCLPGTLP